METKFESLYKLIFEQMINNKDDKKTVIRTVMHAYSKQENKQMSQRTVYRMIKRVEQQIKNHKVSNFKDFQENLRIERIKNISRSFKLEEIQNFKNYLEKSTYNRKSLYNKFKNMMSDLQKQFPELIQNIDQKTNLKFFQYQFKDYYKKINRGLPKANCLDNEKQNQIYKIKQEDQSTNTSCQFINQSQNKNSNNNFNFNSDNFGSDCQKNYNQIKIEEQINQIEKQNNFKQENLPAQTIYHNLNNKINIAAFKPIDTQQKIEQFQKIGHVYNGTNNMQQSSFINNEEVLKSQIKVQDVELTYLNTLGVFIK